jgi:Na+/melibiose symporter-like transporter
MLSKRTSKRTAYIVGALIWAVAMLTSFLVIPGGSSIAVYLLATVVGFGTGGIVVMMYAIFPDIPDIDELKSGERREGIYAAMITFMRKLSSALALFMVSTSLDFAGYVQPVEQVIGGVSQLVEQSQSDTFILVLRIIFAAVPIILLVVALYFAYKYPLTPTVHQRLNQLLAARREGEPETEEMRAEAKELQSLLIGR